MKRLISITALLFILGASAGVASGGPLDPPPVLVQPGRAIFFGPGGWEGLTEYPRTTTLCTANFLFKGGAKVYLASAAHCPAERAGAATHEPIWLSEGNLNAAGARNGYELIYPGKHGVPVYARSSAPGVPIETRQVGTVVYEIFNVYRGFKRGETPDPLVDQSLGAPNDDLPAMADISLTELDKDVSYDPALCVFGGPIGLAEGRVDLQQGVMVGQSYALGQAYRSGYQLLPPRTGLVLGDAQDTNYSSAEHYGFPFGPGDSGAPVMTATGEALGSNNYALPTQYYPYRLAHTGVASMLSSVIPRAEAALGVDLELMTAQLRSIPDVEDCR